MTKRNGERLEIRKMYKLFINGAFVRSESGRSDPVWDGKVFGANVARASRKDARDAVVAARSAQARWWNLAPANRGLIMYRLAEMVEARRAEFEARLAEGSRLDADNARDEVTATIDRIVWYAGWCDKYMALLSSRNPVAGPHLNVSSPEPMGVVGVLAPDRPALLGLTSMVLPALVAGNTVVLVASEIDPRIAIVFSEAVATCDLPPGVLNVLTGLRSEIAPILAKHMDVNALAFEVGDDLAETTVLEQDAAENLKRVLRYPQRESGWFAADAASLHDIERTVEIKTIWHPAGV